MRRVLSITGWLWLWLAAWSMTAQGDEFAKGLAAMQEGDLTEAANAFRASAHKTPSSGALNNLGIVEWQRGHAGAAILAWEQARWINPLERQTAQNLDFARTVAQLEAPRLKWYEAASAWLPANWWVWLAGAGLWTGLGALVLPRIFRLTRSGWQHWLAALGFGIFLFCSTANFGVVSRVSLGVIVRKEVQLRLTPTRDSELIATLVGGEAVRVLKWRGRFAFVQTGAGTGWLAENDFGLVNPS